MQLILSEFVVADNHNNHKYKKIAQVSRDGGPKSTQTKIIGTILLLHVEL